MKMKKHRKALTIVFYAVNGSGAGHLVRLMGIGRQLRAMAPSRGLAVEMYFLTSCEAAGTAWLEGFAALKLPSKSAARLAGLDRRAYVRMVRSVTWSFLTCLDPDLFVVDTFPGGSFHELVPILDTMRRKVLISRAMRGDFARQGHVQGPMRLYDRILVPHREGEEEIVVPPGCEDRVVWTGEILLRGRGELACRDDIAEAFHLPRDRHLVYVTAGGGGDGEAERFFREVLEAAARDPQLHCVVGAGPLYRGRQFHGGAVTWLTHWPAVELFPAMDFAVAAAGYNTTCELLHAGVPSALYGQEKIADDQKARAERLAARGACLVLPSLERDPIARCIAQLKDDALRARLRSEALAVIPENGAARAAEAIFELLGQSAPSQGPAW